MTSPENTPILRDIALSKLIASEKNTRRTGREIGIEQLAASIAAHGLLQSLSVRPVLDASGAETDKFSVSGGGRRLAALKLLAKRKQIAKNYPVPCILNNGNEEEVSLAENVVRENLHPADQFEAFKRLADDRGLGAEEIAARFGVTPQFVRQRMRLGAVSSRLMQVYRDGDLTLDQLMAFAVSEDHARQEQVFDNLTWNKDASLIRRMMTETHIRASDRRAVFIGADAYAEAGGVILRDLFSEDGGGYFEDGSLLDRLTLAKLQAVADDLLTEGWKWAQASIDYPHTLGLSRRYPQPVDMSPENQQRLDALQAEFDALNEVYDGLEELPGEVDAKFGELETEIDSLRNRQYAYAPDVIARGGAFVVLGHDGTPRIERGFLRPDDEAPEPVTQTGCDLSGDANIDPETIDREDGAPNEAAEEDEADDGKPLSDLLIRDLTAHRTLGLRLALGQQPDIALITVIHALAAEIFYGGEDSGSSLDLSAVSNPLSAYADGIEDTEAAKALSDRHASWAVRMPDDARQLWAFVVALVPEGRLDLLAHCASSTVFAVKQPWNNHPRAQSAADQLANALALDMSAYWQPTARSYFGRVTKAHILANVSEGVSADAATRLTGMKKQTMADAAEQLLAGTGWLPAVLRTEGGATAAENADPALVDMAAE